MYYECLEKEDVNFMLSGVKEVLYKRQYVTLALRKMYG